MPEAGAAAKVGQFCDTRGHFEYLKGIGLRAGTIEQYTAALRRYEAYLQCESLLSGTRENLSSFLKSLCADGNSLAGRHFLTALRRLYRFSIGMGYTDIDLTVGYSFNWKSLPRVPGRKGRTMRRFRKPYLNPCGERRVENNVVGTFNSSIRIVVVRYAALKRFTS